MNFNELLKMLKLISLPLWIPNLRKKFLFLDLLNIRLPQIGLKKINPLASNY